MQSEPQAKKRRLIAKYRECERQARAILEEHWGEVEWHTQALLSKGELTAHWRRWARY